VSLFSILSTARDGILAHTAALDVTGQNVAGASTTGYVRRAAILESSPSGGVQMTGTARSFDRFTYTQLVDQEGRLSSSRARASAMADVESLVAPTTNHLADRADALFAAFQELSLHPADTAVRASVVARADFLAAGFRDTADGLEAFRSELFTRGREIIGEVNQRLEQLATADRAVADAKARGEDPSPLLDRRDQIVREIGERVGARAIEDPQGGLTLFAAGGVLYQGGNVAKLSIALDADGAMQVKADRNGNTIDLTRGIENGTLAGVRQARDFDIPGVLDALDSYAKDITDTINAVHASGFGLDGTSGRNLFVPSAVVKGAAHAMAVDPALLDRPDYLAAAGNAGDVPGGNEIAVALSKLARASLAGKGSAAERYGAIASRVGVLRATAAADEEMRFDTVATASALRESASGVSTDEEMINLQRFQRGFEAASRVLRTVDELFDALMQAV